MERLPPGADERIRLQAVQARVRELVRIHGWLADGFRHAFAKHLALDAQYVDECGAIQDRERRLAREVLTTGRLRDPLCKGSSSCLFVEVEGLCPVEMAARLEGTGCGQDLPDELERAGAAAALAALERDLIYQARDLSSEKRDVMAAEYRTAIGAGTHVPFTWRVSIARPNGWEEPPNPNSLDPADLERFGDADYHTILLYRLGGLADTGSLRPIVTRPARTGDRAKDTAAEAAWRFRFPIEDGANEQTQPALNVAAFPPEVAEQMLGDMERWVSNHDREWKSRSPMGAAAIAGDEARLTTTPAEGSATEDRSECEARDTVPRRPGPKLPRLGPHDRQAWQLSVLDGMTQAKIAAKLNQEHGATYTQGQVSRMIGRAKAHAEASGLAALVRQTTARPRTVDPERLELGPRVDKRGPRPSDLGS